MKKVYSEIWDCCNKINDDIEDVMRELIMEWMGEEEREERKSYLIVGKK